MLALAETVVVLAIEAELSRGRQGQPVSIAPDVTHAITAELAVALVHSRYALTGMHAAAGGGLCVYERIGCARYDNAGVDAHYRVTPELTAIAGVHALSFTGGDVALKLAARAERRVFERITLRTTPTLLIAEQWWLPIAVAVGVYGIAAGIETGVTAPLDEPGAWELPLGFTLEYATPRFGVGAAFVWPRLTSGREQPENRAPIDGLDHRTATLWFRVTW